MMQSRRFGKRLPVPSTVQIIHELKLLMGAEAMGELARQAATPDTAVSPQAPEIAERRPS